jgi:phage shock protein A
MAPGDAALASKAAEEVAAYENKLASVEIKVERLDGKVNLLQALVSLNIGISIAIALKLFIH